MSSGMIEDTIKRIAAVLPQSSGDNLLGFRMDLDHAMESQREIVSHELRASGGPHSMLEVTATIAPDLESLVDVNHALLEIWSQVAYQHFQATAVLRFREVCVLRFVTVVSMDKFFVSGTIRVTGDSYPRLVAKHEQSWNCVLPPATREYI